MLENRFGVFVFAYRRRKSREVMGLGGGVMGLVG